MLQRMSLLLAAMPCLRMADGSFRRKAEMALSSLPCAASRRPGCRGWPRPRKRMGEASKRQSEVPLMDEWIEGLVSKLKSSSTRNWAAGKSPYRAMPSTIVRVIKDHSAGVDSRVLRSRYQAARSHLDQLVLEKDPYADTLRLASDRLSQLLKWKWK